MSPTQDQTKFGPQGESEHPVGAQIGRYHIIERLGAGGMGTVYKANDSQLNRVVALKVPRLDGSPHNLEVRVQRFQREARAAAAVSHPNVCPIYDVGEYQAQPFVVMAFIEGESLANRLDRCGLFKDPSDAVSVILQVLDALGAIHGHGIIHRDLKASNVLLDRAGRAVVMDFGLARHLADAEHLTSEGALIGTPAYMAPEQVAGQTQQVGPWTDLYSLGVTLYQMLTGRLPFEGPILEVLGRIPHESPLPPSRLTPGLDAALEAIVLKAMARDPQDRYQNASEFKEALVRWSPTSFFHPAQAGSPQNTPVTTVHPAVHLAVTGARILLFLSVVVCLVGTWAFLHTESDNKGSSLSEFVFLFGGLSGIGLALSGMIYYLLRYLAWKGVVRLPTPAESKLRKWQVLLLVFCSHLLGIAVGHFLATAFQDEIYKQRGELRIPGSQKEGTEYFPYPYASTPSLELSGSHGQHFKVVECTPTSFKWQWREEKVRTTFIPASVQLGWQAKGLKARKFAE